MATEQDQPTERFSVMEALRQRGPVVAELPRRVPDGPTVVVAPAPPHRDLVRWGAVVAGALVTLTALAVLNLFGLAAGLTAIDLRAASGAGELPAGSGRVSAIWAAFAALAAFGLGGFVAGWAARAPRRAAGVLNGLLVSMLVLPVLAAAALAGLGSLLSALDAYVLGVRPPWWGVAASPDAFAAALEATRSALWGTLAGIGLAMVAAAAGGALGAPRNGEPPAVTTVVARGDDGGALAA